MPRGHCSAQHVLRHTPTVPDTLQVDADGHRRAAAVGVLLDELDATLGRVADEISDLAAQNTTTNKGLVYESCRWFYVYRPVCPEKGVKTVNKHKHTGI